MSLSEIGFAFFKITTHFPSYLSVMNLLSEFTPTNQRLSKSIFQTDSKTRFRWKFSHGVFVRKRDADVILLSPKIISFGVGYPTSKVLIVNAMKTH